MNNTSLMDKNAANDGDRLKHPLCLEVIGRCSTWEDITYAETHGGAGRYLASDQSEGVPHIRRTRDEIRYLGDRPRLALNHLDEVKPGGRYLSLLREWWNKPENEGAYPGSVLQAATQLTNTRTAGSWNIRVTESDKPTFTRLSEALKDLGVQPKYAGFQHEWKWLTEPDNLILLIDPFTMAAIEGQERERETSSKGPST